MSGRTFSLLGGATAVPRQNFASVAEGQHRKILTGSWQPLISLEICSYLSRVGPSKNACKKNKVCFRAIFLRSVHICSTLLLTYVLYGSCRLAATSASLQSTASEGYGLRRGTSQPSAFHIVRTHHDGETKSMQATSRSQIL